MLELTIYSVCKLNKYSFYFILYTKKCVTFAIQYKLIEATYYPIAYVALSIQC